METPPPRRPFIRQVDFPGSLHEAGLFRNNTICSDGGGLLVVVLRGPTVN